MAAGSWWALVLVAVALGAARGQEDDLAASAAAAYRNGDYVEAARVGEARLAGVERARGGSSAETASALADLAAAYTAAGEYTKALEYAERALSVREQVLGANDAAVASSLVEVAEVRWRRGEYGQAAPLAERALAIFEKTRGAKSPDAALALHHLAEIRRRQGDYPNAQEAARRALAIREAALGPDDPALAESLNESALILVNLADYSQALPLYEQALRIRERSIGADHPLTAESVNNLAALHFLLKDYAAAETLFRRALAIKEKRLGPDNPGTATALANLAEVYRRTGAVDKAIPLTQRALRIWEQALGPDHPNTAIARNNLAGFYWTGGDYKRALPLLEQATASWDRSVGPHHPAAARARNLQAALRRSAGDYDESLALYRQGLAVEDEVLAQVFAITSEEQKLQYLEQTQGHYMAALSLIQQHFADDPEAVRFGLELVLRRKGIVLDAQSRAREALAGHLQGDAAAAWERLTQARSDLAKLLLGEPGAQGVDAYRQAVENLQASVEREEQALSRRSALVASDLAQRQVTVQEVARELPAAAVLVEYVRIRDWDEKKVTWAATARYLAFVLRPDGKVVLYDLGDADALDRQVRDTLAAVNDPDFLKDLYAYTRRADESLEKLNARVLAPLAPALRGVSRVLLSPDGELNRVPFAALRSGDHYWIESVTLSYLASGRDLLRGVSGVAPTVTLLLVANPAFDEHLKTKGRGPAVRAADYQAFEYPPLPGTAEEAQVIPRLLRGTMKVLEGAQATEGAVRGAHSPEILHLATHGFFLVDPADDPAAPSPLARARSSRFRTGAASPMVRSGLALAGANYAHTVAAGDDGILTALEVSGVDLMGTKLVVLSACETALGTVRAGEGVYGLRRAFVLAGSRNLVMSLWPVSDRITRDQMERFYQVYGEGKPIPEALRAAQLDTIAQLRTKTQASKQAEAIAPPNLWAPFIAQQTGID